jgi:hypothetical protein
MLIGRRVTRGTVPAGVRREDVAVSRLGERGDHRVDVARKTRLVSWRGTARPRIVEDRTPREPRIERIELVAEQEVFGEK